MKREPHRLEQLVHAIMRELVVQCIDIERLAWLEQEIIESFGQEVRSANQLSSVRELVQDQIDQTLQALLIEYDRIRNDEGCSRESLRAS